MKLDVRAFAIACGILSAVIMLTITWAYVLAIGPTQWEFIARFYKGYSVSWLGGIIGAVYGFVDGAVGGFAFAWLYNKLARS